MVVSLTTVVRLSFQTIYHCFGMAWPNLLSMLPLTDDNGNEVSDDDFPVNVLLRACCNQEVRLGNRFSVCLDEVAKTTIILITIVLKCKAKGGRSCKSVKKPAAKPESYFR